MFSGACGFLPGGDNVEEVEVSSDVQVLPEIPLKSARVLPPVDMVALGLIPPILPDQRLREIQAGRNNPFELIPVKAIIQKSAYKAGDSKTANGRTPTPSDGSTASVTATINGSSVPAAPGTGTLPNQPVAPPPPIYPNEARAVVVSGIIEIGNRSYAIVKAPGEPVARNVTVGDRLSGGRVRVQSINSFGGNSSVVLEQNGDSVTREVGAPALPPLTPPVLPTPLSDS